MAAAVTPTPTNACVGTFADGTVNAQLKCVKSFDHSGNPTFVCAAWRLVYANCAKTNLQCSTKSAAWLAAVTVCGQKLF